MTVTNIESDTDGEFPLFFDRGTSQVFFANEPLLNSSTTSAIKKSSTILRLDGAGIGGLSKHITTINEELKSIGSPGHPWSNPNLLGPTSFLLHGPEGCGKTLLLKRLSEVPWRKVYRLDQQWLTENRKDQFEALSQDVFDAALKHQPALILIDDLDRFLQKAETLVNQMQTELEKLINTKVVVAAATRHIYDIDARIRDPSNLGGIELELFPPNVEQREDILRQILGSDLARTGLDLVRLAERCHGFVGRDIKNLCILARHHRREQVKTSLVDGEQDLNEALDKIEFVTHEDFDAVIGRVQPSVLKDSIIEVPKVNWVDIAGVDHVRSLLESIVVRPYKVSFGAVMLHSRNLGTLPYHRMSNMMLLEL